MYRKIDVPRVVFCEWYNVNNTVLLMDVKNRLRSTGEEVSAIHIQNQLSQEHETLETNIK